MYSLLRTLLFICALVFPATESWAQAFEDAFEF
jgi:hypothetical protein